MSGKASAKKEDTKDKTSSGGDGAKYAIKVMETAKAGLPQRQAAKDGIMPRFPFSMMISGSSGSGKTNLLMNIMTRDELYGRYFHKIFVFSPTAGDTDDTYGALKLPKDHFIRDMKPEYLENLIRNRKDEIEEKGKGNTAKGIEWVGKNDRVCIILDDVIAERGFLESPEAMKMFALLRHYLISVIVLMQSYNKLPRALRNNCNAVMIFPANQSEVEVIKDELAPAGLNKKEFEDVIEYATREPYHFMYINRHADPGKRVRHMLHEVIDLDKFKRTHIAGHSNDVSSRNAEKSSGRQATARREAVQPGHPKPSPKGSHEVRRPK